MMTMTMVMMMTMTIDGDNCADKGDNACSDVDDEDDNDMIMMKAMMMMMDGFNEDNDDGYANRDDNNSNYVDAKYAPDYDDVEYDRDNHSVDAAKAYLEVE
jgi:hypothetical protein